MQSKAQRRQGIVSLKFRFPLEPYISIVEASSNPRVKLKLSFLHLLFLIHYLGRLFPCKAEIGAFTNFLQLTTSMGARWETSSHLGGFTSKTNKCFTNDWRSSTGAQGFGWLSCAHKLSNSHPLNQLTRSDLNSHKEEVVRAREVSSLVMGG
jgi:hypothetical protein